MEFSVQYTTPMEQNDEEFDRANFITAVESPVAETPVAEAPICKDKQPNTRKYTKIIVGLLLTVVLALAAVFVLSVKVYEGQSNDSKSVPIEDYVLPHTTLVVAENTLNEISGNFTDDGTTYQFTSIFNQTTEGVFFRHINGAVPKNGVFGFSFVRINGSRTDFSVQYADTVKKVNFQANASSSDQFAAIKPFFISNIAKSYVELSVKLGSFGYLGNTNMVIHSIHSISQWIFQNAQNGNASWIGIAHIDEEVSKTNAIIESSKQHGHWISDTEQIYDVIPNSDATKRRLGGNCFMHNNQLQVHCGNDCYGRCGPDCDCWSWICGDCSCWQGCFAHDYYCSCEGFGSFWCINVFWVGCSEDYYWTYW